jgi:hypothetical protein
MKIRPVEAEFHADGRWAGIMELIVTNNISLSPCGADPDNGDTNTICRALV